MPGNLFIRTGGAKDLNEVAKNIFALINVAIIETRYSENAPGGRYLYGEVLGLRVTLSEADDTEFPTYDFLMEFRPKFDWGTVDPHCLDGFADILARYLARHGLRIARPLEFGKIGTSTVRYGDKDM